MLDGYKTYIGGVLLGIEAALISYNGKPDVLVAAIAFMGVFLTVAGFRSAMDAKK